MNPTKTEATAAAPKARRRGTPPDGVWKLGVLWKDNPRMQYYRSTKKQDASGNAGNLLRQRILDRDNKYQRAAYAILYYGGVPKIEWKSQTGQWNTCQAKAKSQ